MVPVDSSVESVPFLDKIAHLCEYLGFAWLLVQAIRSSPAHDPDVGGASREYLWWAWIYAASYGLLIELLQALVPWRSADWADAAANAVGAAIGVWLGGRGRW